MKNFKKLFGIAALFAVIVFGLALTACDFAGTEYTWVFTNQSNQPISILSNDLTPATFTLAAAIGLDVETKTATSKKKKPKISWSANNTTPEISATLVDVEVTATGYVFKTSSTGLNIVIDQE